MKVTSSSGRVLLAYDPGAKAWSGDPTLVAAVLARVATGRACAVTPTGPWLDPAAAEAAALVAREVLDDFGVVGDVTDDPTPDAPYVEGRIY